MSLTDKRVWWWAGALAVCGLVFAAYLRPDMLFTLATAVWSCF